MRGRTREARSKPISSWTWTLHLRDTGVSDFRSRDGKSQSIVEKSRLHSRSPIASLETRYPFTVVAASPNSLLARFGYDFGRDPHNLGLSSETFSGFVG